MKQALRILLILTAIVGIAIMAYLTSLHYSPEEGAFCNLGEGLSCDIVNKSEYSEVYGIPVSILGLLYFLGVFAAGIFWYSRPVLKKIIFLSIAFLGPSLYLSAVEVFVINNICVFCEISKVLIVAVIILSWLALRPDKPGWRFISWAVAAALVLAGLTYAIQSSAGPGTKYDSFAQCLDERGFKMYGSVTCAFCARQRVLFGDSFRFIEEIECDPRNPDNVAELCIAKNIERTPTWMQEDEEGNELYRFEAGLQPLKKLSEVSGCPLSE